MTAQENTLSNIATVDLVISSNNHIVLIRFKGHIRGEEIMNIMEVKDGSKMNRIIVINKKNREITNNVIILARKKHEKLKDRLEHSFKILKKDKKNIMSK